MMTKQTGSVLIVLLVGLLVSCAPYAIVEPPASKAPPNELRLEPPKVCVPIKKYINDAPIKNLGAVPRILSPRDVAVFQYNYNNEPPKSKIQISDIIFSTKEDTPYILVAIFIKDCLADETPLMPQWVARLMRPIETI
jgi:hypothetical protein